MAEPPIEIDNPAGRLYELLRSLQRIDGNTRLMDAWSMVFELRGPVQGEEVDLGLLMEHVTEVPRMAYETKRRVESILEVIDQDTYVYLRYFGEVEETVSRAIHLHNPVTWAFDAMGEPGWHSLASCSSLLHRRDRELMPDGDRRHDLIETFRGLLEQVREADDLDEDTMDFVLKHLLAILRRLEDVRYFGVQPVVRAVDEMIGAARRRPDLIARAISSKVWPTVHAGILALDIALNLSANALAIGAAISPQPPTQPPAVVVTIIEQSIIEQPTRRELTNSPHGG